MVPSTSPGARLRRLRIGVIDLVTKGPTRALYARVMNPNLASIMPQAVAVWCEAEGHEVTLVCYTGFENLVAELPDPVDLVFIGAFTEAALLGYAISNLFRSRKAVTALGGPHARCYPEDARQSRVSLHVQLLHRLGRAVSTARFRGAERRPAVPGPDGATAARRLARSELRGPFRRLPRRDRGGGASQRHRLHRGKQPVPALGASPEAAPAQRLQGPFAGRRIVVRPRQQVQDRPAERDGQGPPGLRPRQHDPAAHPLRADKLRARARHGRRAGAVRAHQTIRGSHPGGLPRLFAALSVWTGGAAEPPIPARRSRAPLPVPLSGPQPRHEHQAEELRVA